MKTLSYTSCWKSALVLPMGGATLLFVLLAAVAPNAAADQPQWGERQSRNMVSPEKGLPDSFDPESGLNVKWSVALGDNAYGTPVIAGGRIFIGSNNLHPIDPRIEGDYAILRCLNEEDGSLVWKLAVPRIGGDDYLDWPMIAMCSPPTVEGDRVYTMTNRYQAVCLDLKGQANGNDGPFKDEGNLMAPDGGPPLEITETEADVLWLNDLRGGEVNMYPHDAAHASMLLDGPYLYLNTCNGVDNTHKNILRPDAPSLIVLEKSTGRLVAKDTERIAPRIFHSTWSSPAMGTVNGRKLVFFCGGDGVLYAFKALDTEKTPKTVQKLEVAWRFDPDPDAPKENVAEYLKNNRTGPSTIHSMPVFHENRVYITGGGDAWWGKREAWLKCVDATKEGDISATGLLWTHPMARHSCATPAILDGLAYVTDGGGSVYCVDAVTGESVWDHDLGGEIWGSVLVADGKAHVGTRRGVLWTFATGREKNLLGSVKLGEAISSTPVAANGVLYVATQETLFAFKAGIPAK